MSVLAPVKIILLLFVLAVDGRPVASTSAEFGSVVACQAALNAVAIELQLPAEYRILGVCVPKGGEALMGEVVR